MISQGHHEADLWRCSWDKLVLLFSLAQKRQARELAIRDYRSLIVQRIAFASVMAEGNQKAFNELARDLKHQIEL